MAPWQNRPTPSAAGRCTRGLLVVGLRGEVDGLGDEVRVRVLLGEGQLSRLLERYIHLEGGLGGSLKVVERVRRLLLAPLLGLGARHAAILLPVNLVPEHHKREVLWVPGTCLVQKLVPPIVQGFKSLGVCYVVNKDTRVGSSVERHTKGLKALLPCRVPDLQSDELIVDHDLLGEEVRPNGGLVLLRVPLVHVAVHQRSLADTAVAENDHLKQDLLPVGHGSSVRWLPCQV
mmetsp:Transcript_6303/g.18423  ORF Transcript_6303/g.18423 Transcript_6303/m.18423 type:complete len:232 (+) Transcript_6303:844-1539(+)